MLLQDERRREDVRSSVATMPEIKRVKGSLKRRPVSTVPKALRSKHVPRSYMKERQKWGRLSFGMVTPQKSENCGNRKSAVGLGGRSEKLKAHDDKEEGVLDRGDKDGGRERGDCLGKGDGEELRCAQK